MRDPLAVDVGQHVAIAAEQRLGRAHLGADRQLALGETIAAVLLELRLGLVGLRPAGAERALVHLARMPKAPACGNCGAPNGQA